METIQTDILIIGTGGAGLRAALSAHESAPDLKITAVTRGKPGKHGVTARAVSDRMAFHVTFPFTEPGGEEAIREHARDIYEGGGFVSDPNLADILARESADAFYRLEELGVPFVTDGAGTPLQFVTDGSKYARACYTGPFTAWDIEEALINAVAGKIKILSGYRLVNFIKDDKSGRIAGALLISERPCEYLAVSARAVIIAAGGPGSIFADNVYPRGMDAVPWFAALRAGASLVNTEFIQFGMACSRTNMACSGNMMRALPRLAADGRDLLEDVHRIAPDYDPVELLFRKGASWPVSAESPARAVDIAVWKARQNGAKIELDYTRNPDFGGDEYLSRHLSTLISTWYKDRGVLLTGNGSASRPVDRLFKIGGNFNSDDIYAWFQLQDIDLYETPIEIRHAAQHFQGGILINTRAETGVPGLYACGEVAGGQHGANRPGGNALLDCQVMGRIAGVEAVKFAQGVGAIDIAERAQTIARQVESDFKPDPVPGDRTTVDQSVREILSTYVGVFRTPFGLATAEELLTELIDTYGHAEHSEVSEYSPNIKDCAAMHIALAITRAAKNRSESRGSHMYFEDENATVPIPRSDPEGRTWNKVRWEEGEIRISSKGIPMRTEGLK